MITFETDIHIERPIEEVFAYVSEPLNFPLWNSAVEVVREASGGEGGVGSTYVMERELPTGRAINRLDVVASEAPRELAISASAGPTPFLYRYRFASENGETIVKLDAEVELPGAAALVPGLARRAVKRGVDDNLATLKRILELGGRSFDDLAEALLHVADELPRVDARRRGTDHCGRSLSGLSPLRPLVRRTSES
jgi:uncharacterized membrane protein